MPDHPRVLRLGLKAAALFVVLLFFAQAFCLENAAELQSVPERASQSKKTSAFQSAGAGASAPKIARVDPPNWWLGLKPAPMLLFAGEGLEGSKVSVQASGVRIARTKSPPGGHYLFVWLEVDSSVKPGAIPVAITNPAGAQTIYRYPLLPRHPSQGNFQGLSPDDVIYLIMTDRFADGDPANDQPAQAPGTYDRSNPRAYHGGDLRGIADHLDYLRDLGVTAVWLTPVYHNDDHSPQDYHGYGAVDYYAVDEHFGSLRDLQELVTAAHRKGLKIFLDSVPNHIGPRHPWVKDPPESDWFHGTVERHLTAQSPFANLTDPNAPPVLWRDVIEGWFAGILPDMNQENPDVAQYQIQNGLWWAEQTGVDGYRLDTFPYVSRRFWAEWHQALIRAYPHFFTIGEVFNPDPDVTAFFVGGRKQYDAIDSGLTTVFDFPFFYALRDVVLHAQPMQRIVGVLQRDWLFPQPQMLVPFLGNHDVTRFASEPGSSKEKLKLAYGLLLTMRGVPELYYGDEIGMTGGADPDNRHDFPGGFPGDRRDAFAPAGRTADEQDIFTHVQRLLHLRRDHPALRHGHLWHIWWDQTFYSYARVAHEERLLIACNNSDEQRQVRLDFTDTPLAGTQQLEPLLGGRPTAVHDSRARLELPARAVAIYSVK